MRVLNAHAKPRFRFHALLATAALAFGGLATAAVLVGDNDATKTAIPKMAELQKTSNAFAAVTKHAAPAVVFIKVEKKITPVASNGRDMPDWLDDDMMKRFFGERFKGFAPPQFDGPQQPWRSTGLGSGFIISKDGYILTNNHVVQSADRVQVTLADGRELAAEIVGTDKSSDVAVVKVDASDLPVLQMGNSDDLEVGQWVLAVGSPFGLPGTVTSGIVSAKGRNSVGIADYENFVQTDAAINPGNSGGPLLNLNGDVIGINTAIASRTGAFNGIGFAIPINMARDICDQLIQAGSVTRGFLGIAIQPLTGELAESFGMDESVKGVLVGDVTKNSPAHEAGLKHGDVIVEYNGHQVDGIGEFRNRVAATAPDSAVKLIAWRDGARKTLEVTLGRLAARVELANATAHDSESLGLSVKPLTDKWAKERGYADETGVVITDVEAGSAAALAGLRPGWIIKEVNHKTVDDIVSYQAAVQATLDGESVLLLVNDGNYSRFITLRIGE